ncbi:hypothetical protein SMICM304S_09237 [Streptomyces microflavus]
MTAIPAPAEAVMNPRRSNTSFSWSVSFFFS